MTYLAAFKREFSAIFKNRGLMIILFIGPIFLTLYFGGVYSNDYVKDIKVGVIDEDRSTLSHMVTNYFMSNERFELSAYPSSQEEMQALLDEGKIQMGIYIPPHFEQQVTTFQSSQVLVYLDGTNTVVANNALAQATSILQTVSAGIEIKLIQGKGVIPQTAQDMALIYKIEERMLYDSKMTYMNYLIICFFAVFIQQLMLAALGNRLIEDKEYLAEGKTWQKVLATTSACFVGIIPAATLSLILLKNLFHVPIRGSLLTALIMTVTFLAAVTGPALIMAALLKVRVKYSQFSFMLSLPTFISSGCVWPAEQMPKFLEMLIKSFWPLIYYAKPMQEVLLKDRSFITVLPNILQMLVFALVWIPIGVILYKRAFSEERTRVISKKDADERIINN